jgi:hypothetical protein
MTRPPRMPPPARATLKPVGQWSRPPAGFTIGVRPNSPATLVYLPSLQMRLGAGPIFHIFQNIVKCPLLPGIARFFLVLPGVPRPGIETINTFASAC